MKQDVLFEGAEEIVEKRESGGGAGRVRLQRANRSQGRLDVTCLDELISEAHRARTFWKLLESCDVSGFEQDIRSRGENAGRSAMDPRVLLCLWLYSISEGNGSARHLARLCERDAPYRWIAGGLTPSYHTLSSFRVEHESALDELFTALLASLVRSGVVSLRRTAQDGTKVRANAAAGSFRRERSLKKALKVAKDRVKATKKDLDKPARDDSKRKLAAQARAADERERLVEAALETVKSLRKGSQKQKEPSEVRASTTDPEARVMRMADGGYRPAVNAQAAIDTKSRVIRCWSRSEKGRAGSRMNIWSTAATRRKSRSKRPQRKKSMCTHHHRCRQTKRAGSTRSGPRPQRRSSRTGGSGEE